MAKNQVLAIPMVTFSSASMTGVYQPSNPGGFPNPLIILRIINGTNKDVNISYDGVNDADIVRADDLPLQLEFQTNSLVNNKVANMAQGTQVYVKGTAGTGNLYIVGYYQPSAG